MISCRLYEQGDIYEIKAKDFFYSDPEMEKRVELCSKNNISRVFTVCNNDLPIAVLGMNRSWGNTWELWSILGESIESNKYGFAKICRKLLESTAVVLKVRRFQSVCLNTLDKGDRWFRFLGFQKEGIMRSFGPNSEDYFLYSRIF